MLNYSLGQGTKLRNGGEHLLSVEDEIENQRNSKTNYYLCLTAFAAIAYCLRYPLNVQQLQYVSQRCFCDEVSRVPGNEYS